MRLFGGNSPLLIVQNEKGDRSKDIDLKGMQGQFEFSFRIQKKLDDGYVKFFFERISGFEWIGAIFLLILSGYLFSLDFKKTSK